jgi:ferritin
MIIGKTMQDAINEQIKSEIYSAYLYLSMAAYFEANNMPGSAKWMRAQHDEEIAHALKLFDYVNDRGGRVTLKAIDQPPADFASPLDVWKTVLEHEQKVTALIHKLYEQAGKENDHASQTMLQWFITEQVEEEKSATLMYERFKQAGTQPATLLLFDGHFTKRDE